MQLSPHFSLAEFTSSAKAQALGLDNLLPADLMASAMRTADMLERIRAYLGGLAGREIPILLSSGYRCLQLNRALGSKDTGDHTRALAADWSAPAFGTPYQICRALSPQILALGIGQLIYERPRPGSAWVHTSTRTPDRPSNRVITIGPAGAELGIQQGEG